MWFTALLNKNTLFAAALMGVTLVFLYQRWTITELKNEILIKEIVIHELTTNKETLQKAIDDQNEKITIVANKAKEAEKLSNILSLQLKATQVQDEEEIKHILSIKDKPKTCPESMEYLRSKAGEFTWAK